MVDIIRPDTIPPLAGDAEPSAASLGFLEEDGRIQFQILTDLRSIKDNLRNILFFRKGDYPDDPNFGVGLQDYLFEQGDSTFKLALGQEIRRQINRYEKRARIDNLRIFLPKWLENGAVVDLNITALSSTFGITAFADGALAIGEAA